MKTLNSIQYKLKQAGLGFSVLLATILTGTNASAQLNPLGAVYFQNQYLANPAMAGAEKGFHADLAYRKQWANVPGSPLTQSLTADYGTSKKVGMGISIYNDQAGLQKSARVMGTYAYHLPIDNAGKMLSFGVSLGFMDDRLISENANTETDAADMAVNKYFQRDTYVDGDFGVAYISNKLNIQGAIPNLKTFFNKDQAETNVADQSRYFAAISYKLFFPQALDGMGIEPKLSYRNIKGYKSIADFGANFTMANSAVNVMAMYHSSQSATVGMGVKYKSMMLINGVFTSGTAALGGNTNGNFELNLKVNISEVIKSGKTQ